jgi:hypothetical protein
MPPRGNGCVRSYLFAKRKRPPGRIAQQRDTASNKLRRWDAVTRRVEAKRRSGASRLTAARRRGPRPHRTRIGTTRTDRPRFPPPLWGRGFAEPKFRASLTGQSWDQPATTAADERLSAPFRHAVRTYCIRRNALCARPRTKQRLFHPSPTRLRAGPLMPTSTYPYAAFALQHDACILLLSDVGHACGRCSPGQANFAPVFHPPGDLS